MVQLNAKVIERMEFSPGSFILRVAPDGWELPEFKAGQYTVLGLPGSASRSPLCDPEKEPAAPDKLILRAYSVASSSHAKDCVEFYITLVRSGALTARLYDLKIGDRVFLGKKFTGLMTLENVPKEANVLLISTGTGLAPYMSMLRTLVTSTGFDKQYAVIHGACNSWDLGYRSELETLSRMSKEFTYVPVVSEPEGELIPWKGATGFVEDVWKAGAVDQAWGMHPTKDDTHIFLCGNPLMIESAIRFLGDEGFVEHTKRTPGQIHLERFW
ncbi:MAG: ferredoxin--NADP reductase [Elusimicrobiota bacterium]